MDMWRIIGIILALPGAIEAIWKIIRKIRALKKRTPTLPASGSLKKPSLFHLQNGVRAACFTTLAVMLFALVNINVLAPSHDPERSLTTESQKDSITRKPRVYRGKGITVTVRCPEDTSSFSNYSLNDHVELINLRAPQSKSSCG